MTVISNRSESIALGEQSSALFGFRSFGSGCHDPFRVEPCGGFGRAFIVPEHTGGLTSPDERNRQLWLISSVNVLCEFSADVRYLTVSTGLPSSSTPAELEKIYALSVGDESALLRWATLLVETKIKASAFKDLDAFLAGADECKISGIACVAILRSSFRVRRYLRHWNSLAVRVWKKLDKDGENAARRMRGLVDVNDPGLFATAKASS